MKPTSYLFAASLLLAAALPSAAHEDAINCTQCKQWNVPQKPFRIHGSTYYVGTTELSSILIAGKDGHILIDGALPQSAPLIAASIRELGFRMEDVKLILNSHEHFDHAGGLAALQRASGAQVAASPSAAAALERGTVGEDDPQYNPTNPTMLQKIAKVRVLRDGETLKVGSLAVTAHFTPGHTPGGTSWAWRSCEGASCVNIVYADSINPISEDGYYFTGSENQPDRSAAFKRTIDKLAALPCDIIVSVHPGVTDTMDKLARRTPQHNTFIDAASCKAYTEFGYQALAKRVAREQEEKKSQRK
ncbi:subclass B3 metallo-beta-lactamase [Pseudoduganella rhizocola]|uniref:subclass B3 metallo-beta-lactamase n=1 Tax=Pseudoduganella rhizocola TaxID=3382643 RepID=UPI0038B47CF5